MTGEGSYTATSNVVYANPIGIRGDSSPLWNNNLVYGNTEKGIWLYAGSAPQILNNTVVQPAGDALTIESTHNNLQFQNFQVRNNVLWAKSGYAIVAGSDTVCG